MKKEKLFTYNAIHYYLCDAEKYLNDKKLYKDKFYPYYMDYVKYAFKTIEEREKFLEEFKDNIKLVEVVYY